MTITQDCVIFDLDGTMANTEHRQHFLEGEPLQSAPNTDWHKDWKAFFDACVDDTPNLHVLQLWKLVGGRYGRIICSGRPDSHIDQTIKWLSDCHAADYSMLLMRKAGDHRPDVEVKREMLRKLRALDWNPIWSVDDRPAVIRMWEEEGVPCFRVSNPVWDTRE